MMVAIILWWWQWRGNRCVCDSCVSRSAIMAPTYNKIPHNHHHRGDHHDEDQNRGYDDIDDTISQKNDKVLES